MNKSIAFVGGGHMATSLIGGLVNTATDQRILVSEPSEIKRDELQKEFGINTTDTNIDTLKSDVVLIAVKPDIVQDVCKELSTSKEVTKPLYISIAAGVRTKDITRWLGGNCALIRCMPNTPALLQCGATAMYANDKATTEQKYIAESILQSVGLTLWLDNEELMDAVTAVSGSGPAYFFLLMEAIQQAGTTLGLDIETASKLTLQTALGASRMAKESNNTPEELRKRVTSKGGTTEQAIISLQKSGFFTHILEALTAAKDKSEMLANEFGKDKS